MGNSFLQIKLGKGDYRDNFIREELFLQNI